MKVNYTRVPLREIASVDISGVDKKIKEGEQRIQLCNFINVYHNWAITSYIQKDFMNASASKNEISKYRICKGQVAITKDSETRDDIGVSTYIADEFDNVVLGYHCALITPRQEFLNGKFLNAFLHSKSANKYFEANASGSGQRFTLTLESIRGIKIPLLSLNDQRKIGELFSLIDRKIENNNIISKKLEKLAKNYYEYWFVQFDFPDLEGKPYKTSGGKMIYNKKLKRLIPERWTVASLFKNELTKIIKPGVEQFTSKNYLATANVVGTTIKDGKWITYEDRESRANMQPILNSVWFAKMKNSIKHITITKKDLWMINKYILSTGFLGLLCDSSSLSYVHCFINSELFEFVKDRLAHGATQEAVKNDDLKYIKMVIPPKDILKAFNKTILPMLEQMNRNINENQELIKLRDFLLPMLINGQAVIE